MKHKRTRTKKNNLSDPRVLRAEAARASEAFQRLMRGREFETAAEAREFINSVTGRSLDELEMPELTDADRAQDLVFDAWEERASSRRVQLARQALDLWPDCADAYCVLAEEAGEQDEVRRLLEAAVAAGERALDPELFKNEVGQFWGIHATRPYMRARSALAYFLWETDVKPEAVKHARELLRLNPEDNLGIRDRLIGWLLELDDRPGAVGLLYRWGDDRALWHYARALLEYRNQGDTNQARTMLDRAFSSNPYVILLLAGLAEIPRSLPYDDTPGSRSEAIMVALNLANAWRMNHEAFRWLARRSLDWSRRTQPGDE